MTIFQILAISIALLFLSSFLYYKKNIKINRKSKIGIVISPFLLVFISLLVAKIEYSGTIMYKIYGWPHSFLTYKIKDVVEGSLINEWIFNTHNLFIYLISVYLFYLSLIFFINVLVKLIKNKQIKILLIIFIIIAIPFIFLLSKNPDKKITDKPTINEINHQVVEVIEGECTSDLNCKLPFEYGIRSNCPYQAICLNNQCSIICPKITEWGRIKQAISNCSVKSVFQAHSLQVIVKLKNGDTIEAFEPKIDDIFDVAREFEDKCGKIKLGTE